MVPRIIWICNSMVVFTFFFLDRKFGTYNLGQKSWRQIREVKQNRFYNGVVRQLVKQLVHSLFGDNNLVPFHFWWKEIVLKSEVYKCFVQDCRLINSNMEKSRGMFTFLFQAKTHFLGHLVPKFKIVCVKWSLILRLIQICRMVMFTVSIFDQKYAFWGNLVQKIKIFSLSWNLVLRLVPGYWIQWWYSLFLFLT